MYSMISFFMLLCGIHFCRIAARGYINSEFRGDPFVAAHVRPYPDTCIEALRSAEGVLQLHKLRWPICHNGGLILDLVHSLKIVMAQHKVKRLFILTHPKIRQRINLLLAEVSLGHDMIQ